MIRLIALPGLPGRPTPRLPGANASLRPSLDGDASYPSDLPVAVAGEQRAAFVGVMAWAFVRAGW